MVTSLLLFLFSFSSYAQIIFSHKGHHNPYVVDSLKCHKRVKRAIGAPPTFSQNSIDNAFELGADVVEIDLRLTKDRELIIFHDKNLECDSNMAGEVKHYNVSELVSGFLDKKKEFSIISFEDILKKFPKKSFLINPKDRHFDEIQAISNIVRKYKGKRKIYMWGSEKTYTELKSQGAKLSGFIQNHWQSERCLSKVRQQVWPFYFPKVCHNQIITLEDSRDYLIWGGLRNFIKLATKNNSKVYFYVPKITTVDRLQWLINIGLHGLIISDIEYYHLLSKKL